MKPKSKLFLMGLAFMGIAIAINHLLDIVTDSGYTKVLAGFISSDGVVSCTSCALQRVDQVFIFGMLLLITGYLLLAKFDAKAFDLFRLPALTNRLKMTWLGFLALTLCWFFFKFLNLRPDLYREDHLLENLTAIFLLGSFLVLAVKFFRPAGLNRWLILAGALAFFVIGMEEISWGQRIFGWGTPEALAEFNYQGETNLHNVVNPWMTPIYVISNLVLGCLFLFINEIRSYTNRFNWAKHIQPFLPPVSFIWIGTIFLFLSLHRFWFGDELTEQTFSLIGLVYAYNLYTDKGELLKEQT